MSLINEQIKRALAWITETPELDVLSEMKVYGGAMVSEMELIALKETYELKGNRLIVTNGTRTVKIIIKLKN